MAIRTRPIRDVLAAQMNQLFAEADAKAARRQAELYRFILLVGAVVTAVASIVAAVA